MDLLYKGFLKKIIITFSVFFAFLIEGQASRELTLEQARALALTKSLNIDAQIKAYLVSVDNKKSVQWVYEPQFQLLARQAIDDRDNENLQESTTNRAIINQEETIYNARLQNLLPTGGTIALETRLIDRINNFGSDGSNILGNARNIYEREFQTFAGITFEQPLLKKAQSLNDPSNRYARINIQLAEKESKIAYQKLRTELSNFIAQVEARYWELYHSVEKAKLREESLATAVSIKTDNLERLRLGKISELELLETESEVVKRETDYKEALIDLNRATGTLATYFSHVLVDETNPFVPTEVLVVEPVLESREEMLSHSLQHHPDYLMKKEEAERRGILLAYAENQRLPQLDLALSYGYNGLGDSSLASMKRLDDYDKVSWSAGVQLNIPILGDRQAYHEMSAAKRNKQSALLELKNSEVQIINTISSAYEGLRISFDMYENHKQEVEFQEELLSAELAKLEEGKSSSRDVFDVEERLSESRIRELEMSLRYQTSQITLSLSRGQFLAERNIDFNREDITD